MKTGKFLSHITVIFSTFLWYSCDSFLDQMPQSAISPEKYLVEASQLEAYANSLYGILPSGVLLTIDQHTDNQANESYSSKYVPGEWKVPQTDGNNWNFSNIYHFNYFLEQVLPKYEAGNITGAVSNIKHFIGEVYFLRAYDYFNKLRTFGDFPIVTQTLPDEMDALVEASKRSPRNEVARFILSDLDKAIELMDVSIEQQKTRLNKRTALLLKSRVALYEGTFLKYFKGTAFVPNGPNWPGASKDYNNGYHFPSGSIDNEINFFLDQAIDASQKCADMVVLTANTGEIQQEPNGQANPYMDMYASLNLSSYNEVLLWREYNNSLGIVHTAVHAAQLGNGSTGVTRGFIDAFLMANGLPVYAAGSGYQGDDYIADVRADRDNRLFLFLKEPGQKNILWENPIGNAAWPIEPIPNIIGLLGTSTYMYITGYTFRKGNSYDQTQLLNLSTSGSYTGVICFRGAEAYLNYVEAWYERNGSLNGTALQYWQAIRERAKMDTDVNKTIAATEMEKEAPNDWSAFSAGQLLTDATLFNIRRERRCEFLGEGLRWMDLQRWRACDQMINTPYHIEGFKLWGPMQDWYQKDDGTSALTFGLDVVGALVSPPDRSMYLRPYEKTRTSLTLDGYRWNMAHYLNPIAIQDFLITSKDNDLSTSPIYQNPGWPMVAAEGAN